MLLPINESRGYTKITEISSRANKVAGTPMRHLDLSDSSARAWSFEFLVAGIVPVSVTGRKAQAVGEGFSGWRRITRDPSSRDVAAPSRQVGQGLD